MNGEKWFQDTFSDGFWDKVDEWRDEWLDALDELEHACEEYAKPATSLSWHISPTSSTTSTGGSRARITTPAQASSS